MGSPAELEVHAYFHNYHGKLKFIGSQLLRSHPDLPSCNQGLHSNNLLPEGSERFACLWEHCDVRVYSLFCGCSRTSCEWKHHYFRLHMCPPLYRVHLTIPSGSTVMWTITLKAQSNSLLHNNNRLSSASGMVCLSKHILKDALFLTFYIHCFDLSAVGCDAFFKIRYRLREHMRSHTQERLVACPTCGSMFASNTKFFDHLHRQAEPIGKKDLLFCIQLLYVWLEKLIFVHLLHLNRVTCMWALRQSFFQRKASKGSRSPTR